MTIEFVNELDKEFAENEWLKAIGVLDSVAIMKVIVENPNASISQNFSAKDIALVKEGFSDFKDYANSKGYTDKQITDRANIFKTKFELSALEAKAASSLIDYNTIRDKRLATNRKVALWLYALALIIGVIFIYFVWKGNLSRNQIIVFSAVLILLMGISIYISKVK